MTTADTTREASLGAQRAGEALIRAAEGSWTLSGLARAMGVERRALGRVVAGLEEAGLLSRDRDGRITPGSQLIAVSRRIAARYDLPAMARRVVDELVKATGCTVMLHQPHGDFLLPEVIGTPSDTIAVSFPPGRTIAVWEGIGRAVLAYRPEQDIRRLAAKSTRADFPETIAHERQEGVFISRGEVVPGITAIGSPVFGQEEDVVGVLAVVALEPTAPERFSRLVREKAQELSRRLAGPKTESRD